MWIILKIVGMKISKDSPSHHLQVKLLITLKSMAISMAISMEISGNQCPI